MRIFNLTDVETPTLLELGLVNQVLVAGRAVVGPGSSVELGDDPLTRAHLLQYTQVGAMALDDLPPNYVVNKLQREQVLRTREGQK